MNGLSIYTTVVLFLQGISGTDGPTVHGVDKGQRRMLVTPVFFMPENIPYVLCVCLFMNNNNHCVINNCRLQIVSNRYNAG